MKHILLSIGTIVLLLTGLLNTSCNSCSRDKADSIDSINSFGDGSYGLGFNLDSFYAHPNYSIKLDSFTYEDLRILRSIPYARHHHWFKEGEINEKFCNVTQYRLDMMPVVKAFAQDSLAGKRSEYWKLWYTNYKKTYDLIPLTDEEKAFVKRVDAKIAEFEKRRHIRSDNQEISNPELLINRSYIEDMTPDFWEHLNKYNFAFSEKNYNQMFNAYEQRYYSNVPNYVTTDLYLHTYHMYFSWVLKVLESRCFLPAITDMSDYMYRQNLKAIASASDENTKKLAEFGATYYAIAYKLCTEKDEEDLPDNLKDAYTIELNNIKAEVDGPSDFLHINGDNIFFYSLFKARGFYTRSENAKRYFHAMMWLQTAWFCMDDNDGLQRGLYLALQYHNAGSELQNICRSVYDPIGFLMGQPDNMPIIEIADVVNTKLGIHSTADLQNEQKLNTARTVLAKLFSEYDKIHPKKKELMACVNKMNFMPQRYTPDAEILSKMYNEKPNGARAYPSGLDVFDAFGSQSAANVLDSTDKEAKQWTDYGKFRKEMRSKFSKFADFDKTMYNKWMETLVTLQKSSKDKPGYMKTGGWQRKDLNSSLASWAELKHDAILYAEQPMAAEMGDGGGDFIALPSPVYIQDYVEPNLAFWKKMKEMLELNIKMLKKAGFYKSVEEKTIKKDDDGDEYEDINTFDIKGNTEWLMKKVQLCIDAAEKELKNIRLTNEENEAIKMTGPEFEEYTLQILNPEIKYSDWFEVKDADSSIAIVADVFTRNVPDCGKNAVLEEGVGRANEIYVVVERNGQTYITRGAVFDYYEFVDKDMKRYSDEEWQQLLNTDKKPSRPTWTRDLYVKEPVKINMTAHNRLGDLFWFLKFDEHDKMILAPDSDYINNNSNNDRY